MIMESVKEKMIKKIESFGDNPFLLSDLSMCGSYEAIKKEIQRLEKKKSVKRICRGIYYAPIYLSVLDSYSTYDIDKVAYTIARQNSWTICPSINQAMNLTGVLSQVPIKYVYLTSGPYKKYHVGNTDIEFKHASKKYVSSNYSDSTMLVIQAIRGIGKDRMDDKTIYKLKENFSKEDIDKLIKESKKTVSWIYDKIMKLEDDK